MDKMIIATKRKNVHQNLGALMVEFFIYGNNPIDDYPFKTAKIEKDMWLQHEDFIFETFRDRVPHPADETYLRLTFKSGTRPYGWWKYSNKNGVRKVIVGEVEPKSDELFFGKYRLINIPEAKYEYESEFDFLKRHDLLFEGEEEAYLKNLANEEHLKQLRKQLARGQDDD